MSRKKVILSIFLMIGLILIGIVLPALRKMEKQDSGTSKESSHTSSPEEKAPVSEQTIPVLEYIGFDELENFFSDSQIEDLKEQFPSYLKQTGQTTISSAEFLPEQTSYPDKDTIAFQFALSDHSLLPVTYSTSSGASFFGEEKLQVSGDSRTYPRQTDDSLDTVTTEEIESRQEGGYADTSDDIPEKPENASESSSSESVPSTGDALNPDAKEVLP